MRSTYITAAIIALLIGLWLLSGQLGKPAQEAPKSLAERNREQAVLMEDNAPVRVRAEVINAVQRTQQVRVRGKTENKRTVEVRAEVAGRIVERPVERGDRVRKGELLCRLSIDDRQAGVAEARASLQQAQIEYQGSLELKAKGFQSDTAIAQARARLVGAEAQLTRRELDLARTQIRAPFDGLVEDVSQDVGDYVSPGAACSTVVDLDPMLLVGRVSEKDVQRLKLGSSAQGVLSDGSTVEGTVSFIGTQSDPATRTYAVEVEVANIQDTLRSGITTDILVPVEEVLAHKVSPALFALNDRGELGLRTVNGDDRVEFHTIDVLSNDVDGAWVAGLPAVTTLITVGQELVIPGDRVEVTYEASSEMPAAVPDSQDSGSDEGGDTTQLSGTPDPGDVVMVAIPVS